MLAVSDLASGTQPVACAARVVKRMSLKLSVEPCVWRGHHLTGPLNRVLGILSELSSPLEMSYTGGIVTVC